MYIYNYVVVQQPRKPSLQKYSQASVIADSGTDDTKLALLNIFSYSRWRPICSLVGDGLDMATMDRRPLPPATHTHLKET